MCGCGVIHIREASSICDEGCPPAGKEGATTTYSDMWLQECPSYPLTKFFLTLFPQRKNGRSSIQSSSVLDKWGERGERWVEITHDE